MYINKVKHIGSVVFIALLCASCATDDGELSPTGETGLQLNAQVAGTEATRAVGDKVNGVDQLNENKIDHIDVFIGKDGNYTYVNRFADISANSTTRQLLIKGQGWRDTFNDKDYDVHVVANSSDNVSTGITTLDGLKAKVQTDADIYSVYSESNTEAGYTADKLFLMDGNTTWTPAASGDDVIKVDLSRAASKIELSIKLGGDMKKNFSIGQPQWKLCNYCPTASLLAEGEGTLTAGTSQTGFLAAAEGQDDGYKITTYSYPCKWTGKDDAPYILVNIPLTPTDGSAQKSQNWYRIPVRDLATTEDNGLQFDRNHIYYVEATISSLGSSTEIVYDQGLKLNYEVYDWIVDNVNVDAMKTTYLMVSPTLVYMRNVATDTSVKYYSSNDVSISVDEVYYYDKDGKKAAIDKNTVTITPDAENLKSGTITINSPVPTNFTVRFIRFTVTNKDGKSEQVLVKQYPLEYIQNIEGWYSTRTNTKWLDWAKNKNDQHTKELTSSDEHFHVKVYEYPHIYTYSDEEKNNRGRYYAATKNENGTGQDNNHMYVIQVTSTSDKYIISKPKMNPDGTSDDNVVSPAFMLASQLGTVSSFANQIDDWSHNIISYGYTEAASHCSSYKEVGMDGTSYTNWRLPTEVEIEFIIKYQNANTGVMSEVLGGQYYWTCNKKAAYVSTGSYGSNNNAYVRCVRDLTPDEVKKLDESKL